MKQCFLWWWATYNNSEDRGDVDGVGLAVAPIKVDAGMLLAEPHSRTFALIAIKDMPRQIKLICARLEQLFGFTPAERRLGALLLDGYTLQDAARFTNKSLPTARTQLRSMLKKTGSRSQAELVTVFLSPPSIL